MPLVDPKLQRIENQANTSRQSARPKPHDEQTKPREKPPKRGFFSRFMSRQAQPASQDTELVSRSDRKSVQTTLAFLPINRIVDKDTIQLTDGNYTDYLQFQMNALDDSDVNDQDVGLSELYQHILTYQGDVNWIFTSFPIDMRQNKHYLNVRRQLYRPETELVRRYFDEASETLDFIQAERFSHDGYLQVFAKTPEALKDRRDAIMAANRHYIRVSQISLEKKLQLQFKFLNPLERLPEDGLYQADDQTRRADMQAIVDKKGYDLAYLSQIQPQGGIAIEDPNTLNLGNGYERILHVYSYRKQNALFWMSREFLGLGESVVVSLSPINLAEKKRSLNRSLSEQRQLQAGDTNVIDQREAQGDYESLDNLVDDLVSDHEKLFQMHLRIFVTAPTITELEDKQRLIVARLNSHGYSAMPFADEVVEEFKAGLTSFTMQNDEIRRKGQELRARTLAGGYPFLYSQLVDSTGVAVGKTLGSDGIVALNQFTRDRNRSSYSGWYIGKQGQGKSTAIKLTARNNHLLGNYSAIFAVTDEYQKLVTGLGGQSIDGRKATVNFLQIFPMIVNEMTNEVEVKNSYDASKSKASTIFNLATSVKDGDRISDLFQVELEAFYQKWLVDHDLPFDEITHYRPDQYPIASDFKAFVDEEQRKHPNDADYHLLSQKLELLITGNEAIFNQHTVDNLSETRLIVFNMFSLQQAQNAIYNAQYYNLFSFVYSAALRRGLKQKRLVESGQLPLDQVQYTDIISDEFHEVVRANNITLIKSMDQANREGRKVFLGLHWATQGMDDVFPNFTTKGEDDMAVAVKSLFTLSPYRFLFKTDRSSSEIMHYVFGNEISEGDISQIPKFTEGYCVANIAGSQTIKFKWNLNDDEKQVFTGGV